MTVRRAENPIHPRQWSRGLRVVALLCMAVGVSATACTTPAPAGPTHLAPAQPAQPPQPAPIVEVPEMAFVVHGQAVPDGPVSGLAGLYGQHGSSMLTPCRIQQDRMLCGRVQAELDASRPQIVEVAGQVVGGKLDAASWQPIPWDEPTQRAAAQAHLDQVAPILASFDWSRIARPDFAESSRRYQPSEAELKAVPIDLEGYDSAAGRIIWRAQGPDMPAQKPLVTRYAALYIVTDPAAVLPSEMFVTIEGYVEE